MSRDPFQPSIWLGCHMFAEDFRREPTTWEPLDCGLFLCGSSFTRQRSMRKRQPAAYTSWPCFTLDTGCQSISLSVRTGNHFSSFCFLTTYLCESYFSIVTVKKRSKLTATLKATLCISTLHHNMIPLHDRSKLKCFTVGNIFLLCFSYFWEGGL